MNIIDILKKEYKINSEINSDIILIIKSILFF